MEGISVPKGQRNRYRNYDTQQERLFSKLKISKSPCNLQVKRVEAFWEKSVHI